MTQYRTTPQNSAYTIYKQGYIKHMLCGYVNHFRIALRGDISWSADGEGWLFPLRCSGCNKLGGKDDYIFTESEVY